MESVKSFTMTGNDPSDVKLVSINNNVTSIGTAAFRDYTALESVEIPRSVTSIGWRLCF